MISSCLNSTAKYASQRVAKLVLLKHERSETATVILGNTYYRRIDATFFFHIQIASLLKLFVQVAKTFFLSSVNKIFFSNVAHNCGKPKA